MGQTEKLDVVVLLRCRYRTWQLLKCFKNIRNIFQRNGMTYRIYCMPDRPTPEVRELLDNEDKYDTRMVPINDGEKGHRWAKSGLRGLNYCLDQLDDDGIIPRWLYFHDDDEILPVSCSEKLKECLNEPDILAWTATSLFAWGSINTININIFHHSPILFRYRVGDRFTEDGRSVQVTDPIHRRILRNPYRKKTLPFYIRDLSAFTAEDREEQIRRFKQSGKDDAYTRPFGQEPTIMRLEDIEKKWKPVDFFMYQYKRGNNATV